MSRLRLTMKILRVFSLALLAMAALAVPAAERPPLKVTADAVIGTSSGDYVYDGAGNIVQIGADVYFYDGAGRLVTATVSGVTQTYSYDAYGNRNPASTTSPSTPCLSGRATTNCNQPYAINSTNNRLTNATYDDAGNLLAHAGETYTYDALSMMTTSGDGAGGRRQFLYTASGERIAVYQNGQWEWSLRDEDGKVLTELRSANAGASLGTAEMTPVRDYIYRDNLLLASARPGQPPDRHYHLDHLGSPRLITAANGQRIGEHVYLPFGMELSASTTLVEAPEDDRKFTGHERDIRPDGLALDYMHARHYSPNMGRFLSVDPGRDWDLKRPDSWTGYSYAANSPVRYLDADGRYVAVPQAFRAAVSSAYANSATFRKAYDRVHRNRSILQKLTLQMTRYRSNRAETTQPGGPSILVVNGAVARDDQGALLLGHVLKTIIPASGSLGSVIGHELHHGGEFLLYGHPNKAPDQVQHGGGVETESALEVERQIAQELQQSRGANSLSPQEEANLFDVPETCASAGSAGCPALRPGTDPGASTASRPQYP